MLTGNATTALELFKRMEAESSDGVGRCRAAGATSAGQVRWRTWRRSCSARPVVIAPLLCSSYLEAAERAGECEEGTAGLCLHLHHLPRARDHVGVDVGPPLSDVKVKTARKPCLLTSWTLTACSRRDGAPIESTRMTIASSVASWEVETRDAIVLAMMGGAKETLPRQRGRGDEISRPQPYAAGSGS